MREMKGRGFIDFSVSGTALLSSAVLLRMKAEPVQKMEEPPRPPPEKHTHYVPPPLAFPIRFQSTTTSLDEVLKGILDVLRAERLLPSETAQLISRTPAVFEQADDWLVKIEEEIKAFYSRLLDETVPGERLSFLQLLGQGDTVQAVLMFTMLLFLAIEKKVGIVQTVEFGDIRNDVIRIGIPVYD